MIKFGKAIPHAITITPTSNFGYIVKVGCCATCFKNEDEMLAAIKDYVKNPKSMEEGYNNSHGNAPIMRAYPDDGSIEESQ